MYSVERHEHGTEVRGAVPVSHLCALLDALKEDGHTIIDTAIAAKLGATLIVTTASGSRCWRQKLGIQDVGP